MKTKKGTKVAHVTRDSDTTFKVKRSKVNLQGAGAYCGGLPHSLLYEAPRRRALPYYEGSEVPTGAQILRLGVLTP